MRLIRWSGLFLVLGLFGLACTSASQTRKEPGLTYVTLSLKKLTCQGCGARVVRVLKMQKGIKQIAFDKHKVELKLAYKKEKITEPAMIKIVQGMGFEAFHGPGKGAYVPAAKFSKEMDVQWISKNGEAIEYTKHIAKGKVTVFDFYAVWCGPCKDVDHALLGIMKKNPHIALRKINVIDWDRPVAKKNLSGISQLPFLVIYDKNGKKARQLVGRKIKQLKETLAKLSAP